MLKRSGTVGRAQPIGRGYAFETLSGNTGKSYSASVCLIMLTENIVNYATGSIQKASYVELRGSKKTQNINHATKDMGVCDTR